MSQSRILSAPPQQIPTLSNYITLWRSEQLFLTIHTPKHIPEVPTTTKATNEGLVTCMRFRIFFVHTMRGAGTEKHVHYAAIYFDGLVHTWV
jgi:hypothetical protein